jgi:hypothetical protein
VHLRMPAWDRGVTSFLWGLGLGLYLWLGMLAVGVSGATAFILAALAGAAIFLFVRLYGGGEPRRPPASTKSASRAGTSSAAPGRRGTSAR